MGKGGGCENIPGKGGCKQRSYGRNACEPFGSSDNSAWLQLGSCTI